MGSKKLIDLNEFIHRLSCNFDMQDTLDVLPCRIIDIARQCENEHPAERHGHWGVKDWSVCLEYTCSECGYMEETGGHPLEYNYCPECGAKMDGEDSDTE